MIRHIVLFKLKEYSSDEERNVALDNVLFTFRSLVGEIPQIRQYQVEQDIGHGQGSYDVVIDSSFDNLSDLKAYQNHPAHREAVVFNKNWCISKAVIDYSTDN